MSLKKRVVGEPRGQAPSVLQAALGESSVSGRGESLLPRRKACQIWWLCCAADGG